jgi:mono/diheme cytochrome c family protein
MKFVIAIASLLLGFGIPVAVGQPASALNGAFTEAQAIRGAASYAAVCARCHGKGLVSSDDEAPSLTGRPFAFAWTGKTIAEKFVRIKTTMPASNPGTLDDQTVLDIVAFILQGNKYPAGSQELSPATALDQIVIEPLP